MQPRPQPLRGFLLRLIHLHSLEHMKRDFLSIGGIMQSPVGENGNRGQQILQLVMQPPPSPELGKKSQASNARA